MKIFKELHKQNIAMYILKVNTKNYNKRLAKYKNQIFTSEELGKSESFYFILMNIMKVSIIL